MYHCYGYCLNPIFYSNKDMKFSGLSVFILIFSFLAVGCEEILYLYLNDNTIGYSYQGTFDNSTTGAIAKVDGNSITFSGNFNGVNMNVYGTITRKKYEIVSTKYVNDYFYHDTNRYIKKYVLYINLSPFTEEISFACYPNGNINDNMFYVYGLDGEFIKRK